jgi:hypothetical protein
MASVNCEKCRIALEVGDDGTNSYNVEDWTNGCEHQANGTPLRCPHMKAAIEAQTVKTNNGSKRTALPGHIIRLLKSPQH